MSARSSLTSISAIAALSLSVTALSACDAMPTAKTTTTTTTEGPAAPAPGTPPAAPQAAPLTASGAPVALTVAEAEDGLQWAASVVRVDDVTAESAKLFGVAGGDPAMNGLQTYIAFYRNPAEGWLVYQIGDFLDYTVLSQSNGRVDLDIHESDYNEATGQIGDRHRKVIVQWTRGAHDEVPTAVTVTPAR